MRLPGGLQPTVECGSFRLSEDEVYDFARRFDPQDFHLSHEAARHSIFGRLTASGLQTASSLRHAVLKHAFARAGFIASPKARRLRMHRPVYPDMDVAVRFEVSATRPLAACPGVVEVDTLTTGRTTQGELVISMDETNWFAAGEQARIPDEVLAAAFRRAAPVDVLDGPRRAAALESGARRAPIFLEDAPVGAFFAPPTFGVGEEDVAFYRRHFDASGHENHWLAVCLGVPIFARAFYARAENMGGPGIEDIVFGDPPQAGDRLDAEMEISLSRPLNSRPELGVCTSDCVVWNQRGLEVARFRSTTFLRRRQA